MGVFISQFIELYTYMYGRNLPKIICGELDPKSNCSPLPYPLCSELKQFIKLQKSSPGGKSSRTWELCWNLWKEGDRFDKVILDKHFR